MRTAPRYSGQPGCEDEAHERGEHDRAALADRGENRSQRPSSAEFLRFITSGWGERPASTATRGPAADATARRRSEISGRFPGERLVVPAGSFKVRSNDTDYRFRPHSAFAHLTGLGTEQEPDAVLVLHPVEDGSGDDGSGHEAVLYIRPLAGRDTEEFFSDTRYGEFWVGARPTLEELETADRRPDRHLDDLRDALAKDVGEDGVQLRVVPDADEAIEAIVEDIRADRGRRASATRRSPRRSPSFGWSRTRTRSSRCGSPSRRRSTASRRSCARCPRRSRTRAASA